MVDRLAVVQGQQPFNGLGSQTIQRDASLDDTASLSSSSSSASPPPSKPSKPLHETRCFADPLARGTGYPHQDGNSRMIPSGTSTSQEQQREALALRLQGASI